MIIYSDSLEARLKALGPRIQEILQITGIPGCSLGVRHGNVTWKAHFGYRNVEAQVAPTSDTIYDLSSMTKAFTAAAFGCLVSEGKVDWHTPVRELLPGFGKDGDAIDDLITPLDLLGMRTGHSELLSLGWQGNNGVFFSKKETVDIWNAAPRLDDFRASFLYSNVSYCIIGAIVERISGITLHEFFSRYFFEPLGLKRTRATDIPIDTNGQDNNIATAYGVLDDMTFVTIPSPPPEAETFYFGATGLQSSINDMLILYTAFVEAINDQTTTKRNFTAGNPFKECATLITALNFLTKDPTLREQTYACGWNRIGLPGPLGSFSMGAVAEASEEMPYVLEGSNADRLCMHHAGLSPGASSTIDIFPATNTVITVLGNSSPMGNGLNCIVQMILEEIFLPPGRLDFTFLMKNAAVRVKEHVPSIIRALREKRIPGTKPSLHLDAYVGTYHHERLSMYIVIGKGKDGLTMAFHGMKNETYRLRHYHYDTFTWIMSLNEMARRGLYVHYGEAENFLMRFEMSEEGNGVRRLLWHVPKDTGPVPYVFVRVED